MKYILCLLFPVLTTAAEESRLTIERLYSSPALMGSIPRGLKFSPNGQRISFLSPKPENYEILDLWEYDLKTGAPQLLVDSASVKETALSEQEKARRERMRISQRGIVEYQWSHDGQHLVFPYSGSLYYFSFPKKIEKLTSSKTPEMDVKFSNKDQYVSFVRSNNLFILSPKTKKEYAITVDGKDPISYGVAEFIAQEEMDRFTGYWWSKDDQYMALTKVDETSVPWVDRYEIDADKVVVNKQRYPQAGTMNAKVSLGIVSVQAVLAGQKVITWVPMPKGDIYLARVDWTEDGKLSYQIQSRDQKRLELFVYDPKTKNQRKLLEENDKHWINLNNDLRWLKKSQGFLWASERSGHKHIYHYNNKGEVQALTKGDWSVDAIKSVDEDNDKIYFTSAQKSPLEMQLYSAGLSQFNEPVRITQSEGWHEVEVSKDKKYFIDRFSDPTHPTQVLLYKINGEKVSTLFANEVKEGHPLFPYKNSLIAPEYGQFKSVSGETLYYKLYKPPGFKARKEYPLIVMGYGGPSVQVVKKEWSHLLPQILLQKGFMVASVDNRGSPRRGRKFSDALYRAMGTVEVEDHVGLVKHLSSLGFIDPKRVGFYGWSYGGFLSLMLATKASDVFKATVAGAPVTDFSLYDTHYTERYLGKPNREVEAYKRTKVAELVAGMKSRVLIIHGMADDNVLFTNSTVLFKRLQEEGKLYESLTYPGGKHGISGRKNQTHIGESLVDFFERHLK